MVQVPFVAITIQSQILNFCCLGTSFPILQIISLSLGRSRTLLIPVPGCVFQEKSPHLLVFLIVWAILLISPST